MRILVTGGAGFIGSNYVHQHLQRYPNDEIIVLDKFTYAGNPKNLEYKGKFICPVVKGDIADSSIVEKVTKDVDVIVNFAAETHVDRSISGAADFVKTNLLGTYVLLEGARKNNIRFHHISTDEVFGELQLEGGEFNEKTAYDPRNPYSATKAGSDHLVRAYYYTYGLPITISNCSNNFGPRQHPEKLIPLAITNLIEGKKIPIYGDGKYVRDWLYVDDHCRAIDLILEKGKIGETYCIGGMTEDVSNLEIAKMIIDIMGKGEDSIEFVKDRPGHDRRYAIDWSKIKKLGWEPEHDFNTWLKKTVEWYENNEEWWKCLKK